MNKTKITLLIYDTQCNKMKKSNVLEAIGRSIPVLLKQFELERKIKRLQLITASFIWIIIANTTIVVSPVASATHVSATHSNLSTLAGFETVVTFIRIQKSFRFLTNIRNIKI